MARGPYRELSGEQVQHFVERGHVLLLHPYLPHSASCNPSGRPRFITNPNVTLAAPMNFNRDDPADYSPVERAVLRALEVDRLDFRPTAPRERVVPEREARQARMLAGEQRRLGIA